MWADSVAQVRPETRAFHYVNIPATASGYDAVRDCQPTCIIRELMHCDSLLRSSAPREIRRDALLFFFHLTADLAQPFHCYNNSDHGANDVPVIFQEDTTSLHKLWDSGLLRTVHLAAWSRGNVHTEPLHGTFEQACIDLAERQFRIATAFAVRPWTRISPRYAYRARALVFTSLRRAASLLLTYFPQPLRD